MRIITAAVIKGGAGKTTTIAALAQAAQSSGKRVLCVDMDPQANFTFVIGADGNQAGSYDLLHGTPAADLIQRTPQGMDAITASPDLATEKTTPGSAKRLQRALEDVRGQYDFVFIDTPPHMGELTFNALQAATGLIIPLETDPGSLQGLYQITDIAHHMQSSNPALSIIGTVITKYDGRAKINRYMQDVISDKGKENGAPLLLAIRSGVSIREAQAMQQSLFEYAPKSKPAQDYMALFERIKEG